MLREHWKSDIHWHMKHDIIHKVLGMSSVNRILSVFRESCKHGKVLTTTGRFQNVLMGEGLIGALETSKFRWIPFYYNV